MARGLLVLVLALTLAATAHADHNDAAHSKKYVNATGDFTQLRASCGPPREDGSPDGIGGVCFGAGAITPNPTTGWAQITIADLLHNPASAYACQNGDQDLFCGEETGDYRERFCGATQFLSTAFTWNPGLPVYVLVDGPIFGNPVLSPCTFPETSMAAKGTVQHS